MSDLPLHQQYREQRKQYRIDKELHSYPWVLWEYRLLGDPRWCQCISAPSFNGLAFYRRKEGETE